MNFQKNKYCIIKNAIPKILGDFCARYLEMKKGNLSILKKSRYISSFDSDHGYYTDPQIPDTFTIYGDQAMETLFHYVKPKMEKATGLKLLETYAYARLYKRGDTLKRHKDRFSCEVSATLNLKGDPWPIFIDPKGHGDDSGATYIPLNNKGNQVNLAPGDMLVYKGIDLEHWREEFEGDSCAQVFLHFNNIKNNKAEENKFDTRPMLGLPVWFKGRK